jgi:predicted adenylyl cyclase CyaB
MDSELEAKLKLSSKEAIALTDHLESLNAELRYSRLEINTFFDKGKSHHRNNELLRLRENRYFDKTEYIVTFKRRQRRRNDKLKHRDEYEFAVSDGKKFSQVMIEMGYEKIFLFEKKRRSYLLDRCLVEIDEIPKLGFYCEVEGDSKRQIEQVLARIGFAGAKLITSGYGSLVRKLLNKQNFELRFRK